MYGNNLVIEDSLVKSINTPIFVQILPEALLVIGIIIAIITITLSIKKKNIICIVGSVLCGIFNYINYLNATYIGTTVDGNERINIYIILLPIVIQIILLVYCIKKKKTNIEEGEKKCQE